MTTVWPPGVSEPRKVSNGKTANVDIEWTAFKKTRARVPGCRQACPPPCETSAAAGPNPARDTQETPALAMFQLLSSQNYSKIKDLFFI